MTLRRSLLSIIAFSLVPAVAIDASPISHRDSAVPQPLHPMGTTQRGRHKTGIGHVLTTADGGQIFGWDINDNGNDGLLASSQPYGSGYKVSVETFNTDTGKITRSFARDTGNRNSYTVDGIFANDVGLVTHFVQYKHSIYAKRLYKVLNPVSGKRFTGPWTPPVKDVDVQQNAVNQTTTTSVVYAIELKNQDFPDLIVSDIGNNAFTNVLHLDPNQFGYCTEPKLAQDVIKNRAVMATSLDCGAAGGPPPTIATIELKSGKVTEFAGVNCPGSAGCGFANGIGYDSNTGIACTTTQLDGGVEFYDVRKQTGIHTFLPGNANEFTAGWYVANDPLNKLFLIAQPNSSTGPSDTSSIQVYDEAGNFVESIDGFNFTFVFSTVIPARVAINPSKRMGWVDGPNINQLTQFTY